MVAKIPKSQYVGPTSMAIFYKTNNPKWLGYREVRGSLIEAVESTSGFFMGLGNVKKEEALSGTWINARGRALTWPLAGNRLSGR